MGKKSRKKKNKTNNMVLKTSYEIIIHLEESKPDYKLHAETLKANRDKVRWPSTKYLFNKYWAEYKQYKAGLGLD